MEINKKWHAKNKMPEGATMRQKAEWHLSHHENCGCRPIPEKVLEYIKNGKKIPK
jgi:hypothetical protein